MKWDHNREDDDEDVAINTAPILLSLATNQAMTLCNNAGANDAGN